ncbi:DUF58 domain-containing protein [bacterium]|nr:DUF58 domain-containing protein [bacterium]
MRRRCSAVGTLFIVGVFLAAGLGIDTYRTFAYQIFALFGTIILISFVFSLFFPGRLSVHRRLPRFGTVGQELKYDVTVTNLTKRTQQGLSVIEDVAEAGFVSAHVGGRAGFKRKKKTSSLLMMMLSGTIKHKHIPPLLTGDTCEIGMSITPIQRGYLILRNLYFMKPDPFNIFRAQKKTSHPQTLLVLPRRYVLPHFDLPGSRKYQPGGHHLTYSVGDAQEFTALRDYRPGDALRRIHWRSWAKTGKPIIKEYEEEFFVRHALVLDTFMDQEEEMLFEEAVSLAASFVCTALTRDALLELMFVGPEAYCLTTGRGLNTIDKALEVLACVQPCRDKKFSHLANLVQSRSNQLSSVICFFLKWDPEREHFLDRLKAHNLPDLSFLLCSNDRIAARQRERFHEQGRMIQVLSVGHIREELARL